MNPLLSQSGNQAKSRSSLTELLLDAKGYHMFTIIHIMSTHHTQYI